MIRSLCIAALLSLAATAMLAAQDGEEFCPKGRTQLDLNDCAGAAWAHADSLLNDRYQEVIRTIRPDRVQALREAQRAWIRFRDAECEFQASQVRGGSMEPMVYALCMAEVTRRRNDDLQAVLNDEMRGG